MVGFEGDVGRRVVRIRVERVRAGAAERGREADVVGDGPEDARWHFGMFLNQRSDVCQEVQPDSAPSTGVCSPLTRPSPNRHRMDPDTLSPGRRRGAGVTDEAIDRIRELIASGQWGAGTRLPREADLAKQDRKSVV